ncbi:MAG: energy transducer TonB, partial [Bacteroidota bacterium]|nr:energy transducer TonB [Bacteroidota bacterium]
MARISILTPLLFLSSVLPAQTFLMPKPVDGIHQMEQFISEELIFPPTALEQQIKGEVWLNFIVIADGTVKDLRVWKQLQHECDAEALRLAKMIQWQPAMRGDLPVDAEHSMVVKFDPKSYAKELKKRRNLDASLAGLPSSSSMQVFPISHLGTAPKPCIAQGTEG